MIAERAATRPAGEPTDPDRLSVFRHGVASGDPTADSVVLWTRITPGSDHSSHAGVVWEVTTDPGMTRPVRSGYTITSAERDHTVKIDVDGLAPDTTYHYRFTSNGAMSEIGRTRTAPAADANIDTLELGFVAHSPWSAGCFGAYRELSTRPELAAIVHIGDYLGLGSAAVAGVSRASVGHQPATPDPISLADFRSRYELHRSDPDLQAAHSAAPWICTSPCTTSSLADDDVARNAKQAFFEWMPVREPRTGEASDRSIGFGSRVDLFMTGTRRDEGGAVQLPHDPSSWPSTNLKRLGAQWKVVASPAMVAPVNVTPLDPAAASVLAQLLSLPPGDTDVTAYPWDGLDDDRRAMLTEIDSSATDNVVFVAGDSRMSWAGDVPVRDRSVAAQFGIPPVSAAVVGDLGPAVADSVTSTVSALNDHVRHLDPSSQGFGVLLADERRLRMQIWSVSATEQHTRPAQLIAEYTVASGARRITEVNSSAVAPSAAEYAGRQ
ncbi:alkaline phosphatase [Nocardia sp. BMG111209]|uniref:alkaline phosphatase D family protein n=1 Tax=Nocardia sp. BMG111209 TaxID=1160137 RepID=UPI002101AE5A|nr:alkaline phosphatase D family protein [Nocardia sp. BMG111209]